RDLGSISYSSAIESAATPDTSPHLSDFAARVQREASRRGFTEALRQVLLGDGATWIWNTATELFPPATQILDRFHAKEHLGVVESGCKNVVGTRLKRAGMHWTVKGANAIIALRCSKLSGRFQDFWERRSERKQVAA